MGETRKLPTFEGVKTRLLEDHERPYGTVDRDLPLVIEPASSPSFEALTGLLSSRSQAIKEAVYDHGAVLFRGFAVEKARQFEAAIKSIEGVVPMQRYFMPEEGRDLVDDTESVFFTNRYMKTGGSFAFPSFHSENFYTTDVPALQTFWCETVPWIGGESGLIHMANGFADLPPELQAKLEKQPIASRAWTLTEVAAAYRLPLDRAEAFFRELGLLQVSPAGDKTVVLHKPTVYRHPHHGKLALQVNVGGEAPTVVSLINKLLVRHYTGPKWALHRYAWKHAFMSELFTTIERLPAAVRYPEVVGKLEVDAIKGLAKGVGARLGLHKRDEAPRRAAAVMMGSSYQPVSGLHKLSDLLTAEDCVSIAKAARKHCSVFTWKQGDIVLFDNLQVWHSGMPGLGPRSIRVMMCNPIPMHYPFRTGRIDVTFDPTYRSVDERLLALAAGRPATSAQAGSAAAS
ncbi:MAG: TauD/TfdA family dioxygenase [Byssovorax sp.]